MTYKPWPIARPQITERLEPFTLIDRIDKMDKMLDKLTAALDASNRRIRNLEYAALGLDFRFWGNLLGGHLLLPQSFDVDTPIIRGDLKPNEF